MVPDYFAPASTVYLWFLRFRDEGVFETISHRLRIGERKRNGRDARLPAAVIASQSAKTALAWSLAAPRTALLVTLGTAAGLAAAAIAFLATAAPF